MIRHGTGFRRLQGWRNGAKTRVLHRQPRRASPRCTRAAEGSRITSRALSLHVERQSGGAGEAAACCRRDRGWRRSRSGRRRPRDRCIAEPDRQSRPCCSVWLLAFQSGQVELLDLAAPRCSLCSGNSGSRHVAGRPDQRRRSGELAAFPVLAADRLRQRARWSRRRLDTVKQESADGPCRLLRRLHRKPRALQRGKRRTDAAPCPADINRRRARTM